MVFSSLFELENCSKNSCFKKIVLEMHFLYKKFKIRKDWSLLYFVIRTDRSLTKFGKFGEIGALNSERLKHPSISIENVALLLSPSSRPSIELYSTCVRSYSPWTHSLTHSLTHSSSSWCLKNCLGCLAAGTV